MSTMYYTYPEQKKIGQMHSLGKGKGLHFTWCMLPLEFCEFIQERNHPPVATIIRDEYDNFMSYALFSRVVHEAASQSFDERIE